LTNGRAVKWSQEEGVKPLFTGLTDTWAYDISADGLVVLGEQDRSGTMPHKLLIETANEGIISVSIDAGPMTGDPEISDNGKVVIGSYWTGEFNSGGSFRWTKESGVVYLDPLPDGKRTVFVQGVSADGSIIVGSSEADTENRITVADSINVAREPFIWDETKGTRYLFDVLRSEYGLADALAGWSDLALVRAISGDGRTIVGLGVNPDGNGEAWVAYLGPRSDQLAGDFNANGAVDAADYVVWRNNGGTPQEYATWRAHFGQTMASSEQFASPSVPEPSILYLASLALTSIAWRFSDRRVRQTANKA
jgi:hypothetical protein